MVGRKCIIRGKLAERMTTKAKVTWLG